MSKSKLARAQFFLRIGQVGAAQPKRDEETLPLFALPLIMDCEGLLAPECRALVRGGAPSHAITSAAQRDVPA